MQKNPYNYGKSIFIHQLHRRSGHLPTTLAISIEMLQTKKISPDMENLCFGR